MGVSVENATVKIQSTKLSEAGPVINYTLGFKRTCCFKIIRMGCKRINCIKLSFQYSCKLDSLL